jgi:hypothetical protein
MNQAPELAMMLHICVSVLLTRLEAAKDEKPSFDAIQPLLPSGSRDQPT